VPVPPVPVPKAVITVLLLMLVPVITVPIVSTPDVTAVTVRVFPDTEPVTTAVVGPEKVKLVPAPTV
jgi:hypothetical protein